MFLIVNAALGAGLLNFPTQFDKAGMEVVAVGRIRFWPNSDPGLGTSNKKVNFKHSIE